jgi:hypothetical protein
MNIAIVLYGQPRDYLKGYNNIIAFIKTQKNCKFDFFYHTWKLNKNESYKCSPWRNIDTNNLIYHENIINNLQELYNPISYEISNQNELDFDDLLYKNTIAFNNTRGLKINNINNILYQMYSRNKARNLLYEYLNKIDNTIHYDFVMILRFDINIMPEVNLNEMDTSKTYISDIHYPRKVIPDNCIITPTKIFLEWFNIYETLKDILDNADLLKNLHILNEDLHINAEELILAKYIFHYKNFINIRYFKGGLI